MHNAAQFTGLQCNLHSTTCVYGRLGARKGVHDAQKELRAAGGHSRTDDGSNVWPITRAVDTYLQQQDEASLIAFSTASRVSPVRF
jgi:hypothetical protein